jgi:cell volume regulation protein A
MPIVFGPLLKASAGGVGLAAISTETLALFIGVVFLGTLILSKLSMRIGIPAILTTLVLGLLINIQHVNISPDEVGRLQIFALALLLFYAGLKTDLTVIRGFLLYGLQLAIGGVVIATVTLGLAIHWFSSASGGDLSAGFSNAIPLGAAMLIAACLGSTDAGATLSVLEQVKRRVPERVRHLLEFESAVNDPSALIIYGICTSLFRRSGRADALPELLLVGIQSLLQQVGTGLVLGLAFGFVAKVVIDRFVLDRAQLLVVAMSVAFMDYGITVLMGGSGFVAVYVTGLVMTNVNYRRPEFSHEAIQEVLVPFNSMAEISTFLLFGLLVNPADLLPRLPVGVASAAVLMLVARPVSVLCFQRFSPFNWRDSSLIAWCGLRGAVPLALSFAVVRQIPDLRGVTPQLAEVLASNAQSIVFIVVILNLLLQGLSLAPLCRWLNAPAGPGLSS